MKYERQVQGAVDRLDQSLRALRDLVKKGKQQEALNFMETGPLKDRFEELQNIIEISKVGNLSILIPLVRIHELRTSVIAAVICFVSSDSIARIRIFSSLTKNGRYLIFRSEEGRTNSYVGVAIFGNGIMFIALQYFYL